MKRLVLRAAVTLAEEAERRIREAGRVPPPRADLAAALLPAARDVESAARAHRQAAAWHAEMAERAEAAAGRAAAAVAGLADRWIVQAAREPRWAKFDPQRHRPALVSVPLHAEGEPSKETSC
jgi:hypothetical protein